MNELSDEDIAFIAKDMGKQLPCRWCKSPKCIYPDSSCEARWYFDQVPKPKTTWLGRLTCWLDFHPYRVVRGWCKDPVTWRYCTRCGVEMRNDTGRHGMAGWFVAGGVGLVLACAILGVVLEHKAIREERDHSPRCSGEARDWALGCVQHDTHSEAVNNCSYRALQLFHCNFP